MPFDASTTEYDAENAYRLIRLANLSYLSRAEAKRQIAESFQFQRYHFLSRKGTQCVIVSTKECIFIAFRGTQVNQIEDILADVEAVPRKAFGGEVHRGFYAAYQKIRSKLLLKLKLHGAKPIFICGHSLGGALATLAAVDLLTRKYPVQSVYTAGQPRVGDSAFANQYHSGLEDRTYRFTHVDDIVPSIPPKKVPVVNFQYQHVGKKIYVVDRKTLTTQYKRSHNIFNRFADAGSSLSAHSCDGYEAATKNNTGFNPFVESKPIKESDVVEFSDIKNGAEDIVHKVDDGIHSLAKSVGDFAEDGGKTISKFAKKWF